MKIFIFIILCFTLAVAVTINKPTKLHFRNLFKHPVKDIKIKPSGRIIGGQEAEPHSIPNQAFLEVYSDSKGWYCGGSLISENYVLTAGHCGRDAIRAQIILGAHKPLEGEDCQVVVVSTDIKVHENYDNKEIINDVAVIKLLEPVKLSAEIRVVTLPSRSDDVKSYEGATARISGWGLTEGFGDKVSDVLNYVDVKVITNAECEDTFGSLLPSILCTSGSNKTGSCNGDSGGPLMVGDVQVGVVSFGMFFCLPGFPSGFSRVTSFLDWIGNNTDVQIR